jgi:Ca2+-transporting ATPase
MGEKGTDVAKESAALILLDDNFNTITQAIEIGRLILFNIRKFTMYLLSCNLSEIMIMLLAIILSLPFPLTSSSITINEYGNRYISSISPCCRKANKMNCVAPPIQKRTGNFKEKEWYSIFIQSLFMTIGTIGIFL